MLGFVSLSGAGSIVPGLAILLQNILSTNLFQGQNQEFWTGCPVQKRGVFRKRGLFRRVHSLEILENLETLEILRNPPNCGKQRRIRRQFRDFRDFFSEKTPFVMPTFCGPEDTKSLLMPLFLNGLFSRRFSRGKTAH